MRYCVLCLLVAMGCKQESVTDPDGQCLLAEVPASSVATPPADEADVMNLVPAELVYTVAWSMAPVEVAQSEVTLSLSRSADGATVAERGAEPNLICESGSYLRVPYDLTVRIGDGDVVAVGPAIVQADDQSPPSLFLLTGSTMVFSGPSLTATLSDEWEAAAVADAESDWSSMTWSLYVSGPIDVLEIEVSMAYESPEGDGLHAQWLGDATPVL